MPNPALGALQAEASVIQGHISAATAKMAEMLLTMDNPAGRLSMTKHERISRQLRLRSCAGCQCIELDPVGLLEILRGPRRCCSASQYWTSLEANEISLVGRVGVTLAPLRPVIFGSPDVVISGYPQIYPHKTAEQNGIATRQKDSLPANRIFAALTYRCRDLATCATKASPLRAGAHACCSMTR